MIPFSRDFDEDEGAGGRHGDGRYVPPTRRQLGDVLQVEVEIRGLEVSEAWRLRALEEENARPENAVVRRNRDPLVEVSLRTTRPCTLICSGSFPSA
jgi:hypothetical protein